MPTVPADVTFGRSAPDDPIKTVHFFWTEGPFENLEVHEYIVRTDDPTCDRRPDINRWFEFRGAPPRFENARIVVTPGRDRAYVGYTIIGSGEPHYANPTDVRVVGPDEHTFTWKHQTSTGGPADISAGDGRHEVVPASGPEAGDADYVDASDVVVGQTVTATFSFSGTGEVKVPFEVVAAE